MDVNGGHDYGHQIIVYLTQIVLAIVSGAITLFTYGRNSADGLIRERESTRWDKQALIPSATLADSKHIYRKGEGASAELAMAIHELPGPLTPPPGRWSSRDRSPVSFVNLKAD
jgi:hypothetical protein